MIWVVDTKGRKREKMKEEQISFNKNNKDNKNKWRDDETEGIDTNDTIKKDDDDDDDDDDDRVCLCFGMMTTYIMRMFINKKGSSKFVPTSSNDDDNFDDDDDVKNNNINNDDGDDTYIIVHVGGGGGGGRRNEEKNDDRDHDTPHAPSSFRDEMNNLNVTTVNDKIDGISVLNDICGGNSNGNWINDCQALLDNEFGTNRHYIDDSLYYHYRNEKKNDNNDNDNEENNNVSSKSNIISSTDGRQQQQVLPCSLICIHLQTRQIVGHVQLHKSNVQRQQRHQRRQHRSSKEGGEGKEKGGGITGSTKQQLVESMRKVGIPEEAILQRLGIEGFSSTKQDETKETSEMEMETTGSIATTDASSDNQSTAPSPSSSRRLAISIDSLVVDPIHRGYGLGKVLSTLATLYAVQKLHATSVEAYAASNSLVQFYHRLGAMTGYHRMHHGTTILHRGNGHGDSSTASSSTSTTTTRTGASTEEKKKKSYNRAQSKWITVPIDEIHATSTWEETIQEHIYDKIVSQRNDNNNNNKKSNNKKKKKKINVLIWC